MPKFDVHSYCTVRIKIEGVEADSHEAAIAAVEADFNLKRRIDRIISYDRPGEQISAIELDEAPASGFLVDVCGDDDFTDSLSFDIDKNGNPIRSQVLQKSTYTIPESESEDEIIVVRTNTAHGVISRFRSSTWRRAAYHDGFVAVYGMKNIYAYFYENDPSPPRIQIETYPGYIALYGPSGTVEARIMSSGDRHELRVFDPHYSKTFSSRAQAAAEGFSLIEANNQRQ